MPQLSAIALPQQLVEDAVRVALAEDLGLAGDITTAALILPDARVAARVAAREALTVAGLDLAVAAFRALDPDCRVHVHIRDGEHAAGGTVIATVEGNTGPILSAERTALNFLQHLSGIATTTRTYVEAVHGTKARIVCTRKTLPGLRALQKYAVRCGGGSNHRFGLFDAILIKDNHISAAGGVAEAIARARAYAGHLVKIEVEVDTLGQLDEVLAHPVDAVLLDNMDVETLSTAVRRVRDAAPAMLCEASGGVTLKTVRAIAETGVDMISAGALTHSVKAADIGLDF
jgi:nicotinate-nucleotide pyrophosphorylase (carboxylating)